MAKSMVNMLSLCRRPIHKAAEAYWSMHRVIFPSLVHLDEPLLYARGTQKPT